MLQEPAGAPPEAEKNVVAIIVTYNPDISRLSMVLAAAVPQTRQTIIVDNHSSNVKDIEVLLHNEKKRLILLIKNPLNLGIGAALNQAISSVRVHRPCWVLILDQDTVVDERYFDTLMKAYERIGSPSDVVMLSSLSTADMEVIPSYLLPLTLAGKIHFRKSHHGSFAEPTFLINGGSIIRFEVFNRVRYREEFFLDEIDYDFCFNVKSLGYRVLLYQEILMNHQVGKRITVGRQSIIYQPIERYYLIVRNTTVLALEHKKPLVAFFYGVVRWFWPLIFVAGPSTSIHILTLGIRDGMRMRANHREQSQ